MIRLPPNIAVAVAVAVFLAAPGRVTADKITPRQTAEAREHFQAGMKHYDLAEYDAAIIELKRAYEISSQPQLLFNIAQAARKARQWETARNFFQSYLRQLPRAPNRRDVEKFMAEAEQQLRAEAAAAAPANPPVAAREAVPEGVIAGAPIERERESRAPLSSEAMRIAPPADAAPAPHPGRTKEVIGGGVLVAGAVVVGIGGYFAARAASDSSELDLLAQKRGTWSDHARSVFDDGQSAARNATALFVVGGVVAAVGAALAVVGAVQNARAVRLALAPAVGGAVLGASGSF